MTYQHIDITQQYAYTIPYSNQRKYCAQHDEGIMASRTFTTTRRTRDNIEITEVCDNETVTITRNIGTPDWVMVTHSSCVCKDTRKPYEALVRLIGGVWYLVNEEKLPHDLIVIVRGSMNYWLRDHDEVIARYRPPDLRLCDCA